ncbi:MAG: polyprenyl synthetase family protein [Planctomycetota bacterium]|nr:polyprenyl synthetase family protein [Planctomycetota bacterium]
MTPPPFATATAPAATAAPQRPVEPRDAMAFAMERLWPAIGITPESPMGLALADALLAPSRSMLVRGGKRFRGHLVELCWQLGGGQGRCPDALPAVIEVIHAGSLIIDDIEDGSHERRGAPSVHRLYGMPLALNAGNWLYFWAFELLRELALDPTTELELHRRLTRMLVQGHAGQALDLHGEVLRIDQDDMPTHVASTSRLKTGSFMALAAVMGTVAAGAPSVMTAAVERFGHALGGALQMLDDLGNLVGAREHSKRHEDLLCGRATWPWAWYAELASPGEWRQTRERLAGVCQGGDSADELARHLLQRVGLVGRQRVQALLAGAFSRLETATGSHPLLEKFRAEMARLETSYV